MDENSNIISKLRYSETMFTNQREEQEKEKETKNEEEQNRFIKSIDIGKDLVKQLSRKTFELFKSMVQQCVENWQV